MAGDVTIRALGGVDAAREPTGPVAHPGQTRKAPDVAQKFEAFVLQTFIKEMMPDTAEGVFGSGIAGDFWKSMMAEKIADQVAERGSIGIANYVKAPAAAVDAAAAASPAVLAQLTTMNEAWAVEIVPHPVSGE